MKGIHAEQELIPATPGRPLSLHLSSRIVRMEKTNGAR